MFRSSVSFVVRYNKKLFSFGIMVVFLFFLVLWCFLFLVVCNFYYVWLVFVGW